MVHFDLFQQYPTFLIPMGDTIVTNTLVSSTLPHGDTHQKKRKDTFGACVMVKDDNDLLYEWIAYHYTVLPLGMLVVGSDIGNTQDPAQVLRRWDKAGIPDFRYWILQPDDFIHRHGAYNQSTTALSSKRDLSENDIRNLNHHALIQRQKGFLTTCTELLKKQGAQWVVYIDTDEFVTLNPLATDDELLEIDGKRHSSISNRSYAIRNRIANTYMNRTVIDIISDLQLTKDISECYTMPRLLVGALENRTCHDVYGWNRTREIARNALNDQYQHMSTLRFTQHAKKGDFSRSKYGKVMLDLSKISEETVRLQQPRNIHRPYAKHCGPAGGAHFPDSFFFLMHYIGSWERYMSRGDLRRSRSEWEERAFVDFVTSDATGSSACASRIQDWYSRLFETVGEVHAKFLLGAFRKTAIVSFGAV